MSTWTNPERCQLCGSEERRDLRWSLVKWADAEPGMAYEHVGRCNDEDACRRRIADQGESWPLEERTVRGATV